MTEMIKVAKKKTPNKYHGMIPADRARFFFEKHPDLYVEFKGEVPVAPEPEKIEIEPTEAVEPAMIRRSPKAGSVE